MGLISRVSSRTYRLKKMVQYFFKDGETTQAIDCEKNVTVGELKEALEVEDARLLASGQELNNDELTLEDLGIQKESTIEIIHRVVGGGRKRKKKVYTTPKKIKHKRKKVKLATLKYYKVTDTGKLERLRKENPMMPGVFMATHKDRYYCGKTGLTIFFDNNEKK